MAISILSWPFAAICHWIFVCGFLAEYGNILLMIMLSDSMLAHILYINSSNMFLFLDMGPAEIEFDIPALTSTDQLALFGTASL